MSFANLKKSRNDFMKKLNDEINKVQAKRKKLRQQPESLDETKSFNDESEDDVNVQENQNVENSKSEISQ